MSGLRERPGSSSTIDSKDTHISIQDGSQAAPVSLEDESSTLSSISRKFTHPTDDDVFRDTSEPTPQLENLDEPASTLTFITPGYTNSTTS